MGHPDFLPVEGRTMKLVILVGLAIAALCTWLLWRRETRVREVDSTSFITALRRKGWKPRP
jgi:hypothetical protein